MRRERIARSASAQGGGRLALFGSDGHSAGQDHTFREATWRIDWRPKRSARSGWCSPAAGARCLSAGLPQLGIGVFGIAFAFGLAVVTMVYAFGHISGCHINPAVTVGLLLSKRFPAHEVPGYIAAQVIGGILGGGVLYLIASGQAGVDPRRLRLQRVRRALPGRLFPAGRLLRRNGVRLYFLLIILGATDSRAPQGFAPLAIGLAVALINWAGIPVTNLSLNPARSTATAVFADGWALQQLWLFWVAPILGGAVAGVVYPFIAGSPTSSPTR